MDKMFENDNNVDIHEQEINAVDMITLFDDCESGFLAKNQKLITWLLS